MKVIKGYVCAATVSDDRYSCPQELLFGPRTSPELPQEDPERFETNGLVAFENPMDAASACRSLRVRREVRNGRKEFSQVGLARVEMVIAETEEEMESMRGLCGLVVVQCGPEDATYLLGPSVDDRPTLYPLPAALLSENGYVTFCRGELEKALLVVRELHRKDLLPASIATFKMTRLQPSTPREPSQSP